VYPKFNLTPPTIDQLAEHIAAFSLGGIQAVKQDPSAMPVAVPRGRGRRSAS
jgi:hypothetical protein